MDYSAVNTIWVLLGAALVFFMQAGFAMVETGFTRAKNAGNIIMKNLMDFCIGTPVFWLVGFGIMFGTGNGFLGSISGIASEANYGTAMLPDGVPFWAFLIFQTVFCATSATIVSGAMAERTKFSSYCIYSFLISLVVYPVSGHWIWGGGWLAQMGFHDFAGSCAVHMVGGVAALVGAKILGPRIGKYSKSGKSKAIPGHNLTIGALGVFILWLGWYGFNGAAATSIPDLGSIFLTTTVAPAVATVVCMIFTWIKYGAPDVSMCLNASLAGLVAITAPCDVTDCAGAAVIGAVAGLLVVFGVWLLDYVLKIDDPVGAVAVHMMNGIWGTIAVGLFATKSAPGYQIALDGGAIKGQGLFYGGGFHQLGLQFVGMFSTIAWTAVTITITFLIIKATLGLRVSEEEELVGLDVKEHGLTSAYADFMPAGNMFYSAGTMPVPKSGLAPVIEKSSDHKPAMKPIADKPGDMTEKFTKISIICQQNKFDELKEAMNQIGVNGITVTQVMGCGTQKGITTTYRGAELSVMLIPKVKVEVVISSVPIETVIETAKRVLYTGHYGDGKIFVYDVENVVKVRTGEEGFDALQDATE